MSASAPPFDGDGGWADDVVAGALTMAAVLVAFGTVYGLGTVVSVPSQDVVLAVVLTLTLTRALSGAHHRYWLTMGEVPVLGVIATCAGWLLLREPWIGQPLLVVALCVGAQTRRWDGLIRQAGRLVSLPFLALLITPLPHLGTGDGSSSAVSLHVSSLVWGAAVGLLAVTCALGAQLTRARLVPSLTHPVAARVARRAGRLDAGTRTALQLLVALGLALALGHLLFGERWSWAVVSAYLVMSGARGRGDVVHKAGLRVLGAALGTVAATLVTVHRLQSDNRWLIVALFTVMAAAVILRQRSYAFWAAGVTAMIALLSGYYGQPGSSALPDRVLGVLLGSALGVTTAWFVLPLRTSDVLRRYLADCLAALTDDLNPVAQPPSVTPAALHTLQQLGPTLRAHHRLTRHRNIAHPIDHPVVHAVDAIAAMQRLAVLPADEHEQRQLRRDVVRVRRAIIGIDHPPPDELHPDLAIVHHAIQATLTSR